MNPYYIYAAVGLLEVTAEVLQMPVLRYISKPLLMPVLLWAYSRSIQVAKDKTYYLLAAALLFSFSGDVNLMFEYVHPAFFLLGLGSFLITHILYIDIFRRTMNGDPLSALKQKMPFMAVTVMYCSGLMSYLFPLLGEMTVPVLIYGITIFSMTFLGILRLNPFSDRPARITLLGAILFVLSDSCIAINKFGFNGKMPGSAVTIMTLYITAQFFLVKGISMYQLREESSKR